MTDPFVIDEPGLQSHLDLGEDDDGNTNDDCTHVPHVYFVGNMEKYKEELLVKGGTSSNIKQYMKVISVPQFYKSHSIVLLDLKSL